MPGLAEAGIKDRSGKWRSIAEGAQAEALVARGAVCKGSGDREFGTYQLSRVCLCAQSLTM